MKYNFVGYGSLLSHKSLKKSIEDKNFTPVIIKGYKRIFNISTRNGQNSDILNIVKSRNHNFNGVLFKVDEKELKNLKIREDEYNLEKTSIYSFKTQKKIGKGFFVIDYYVDIDKNKKLPSRSYFIMCRNAAYKISREFGRYWDRTTYISDNEKVSDWIISNKSYNSIKLPVARPRGI